MAVCEICKANPATIHLHLQYHNEVQDLNLCQECYAKLGNQMNPAMGGFIPSSSFGGFGAGQAGQGSLEDWLQGISGAPNSSQGKQAGPQTMTAGGQGGGGLLEELGRNLTASARAGKVDPVIGRDKEIARVIEILNRRNKNNPVLIGEPGVGKTAIAEGLALRVAESRVPRKLLNKQVYLLDVAGLVANTGIRGQFEERMKQLIAEVQQRKDVLLFIDEIHLLVGAGSAQGSMDAGNILKPALGRGELQVIGATTLKEYRQIEKDAALERRLQPVLVEEPTVEETQRILEGLREKYEQYHQVKFNDEVLKACAVLSHRYIQDRFLPDKAIDLMDEAGSKVNLREGTQTPSELEARVVAVRQQKDLATKEERYEQAAQLRDEEQRLIQQFKQQKDVTAATVTIADIEAIVEQKTGIPVGKLQKDEQAKMKDLEERLASKVVGQQPAVAKVARAIRRSRAGLKASHRPIGTFLFVGPTGVGKTELAKVLAEQLFGDRDALIRLDMSEYMEKHSVSKIIGSPPGYVGYEEAGQLTEQVRHKPYSIVLLDEIEKAHPDVQHIFLQILEDGRLTDGQGRTVSFKDTVIIMTSNAGAVDRKVAVGFGQSEKPVQNSSVLSSLHVYFKPEFLNRFDAIVEFDSLQAGDLVQIVSLMLQEVVDNLHERGVQITFTETAKAKLAELGYSPVFGARPLRRVIQEQVEDRIADVLLEHEDATELRVDVVDKVITVAQVELQKTV
ncbi:ATP-dependent Clp protease ATP-binding subunit [Alicyclobacillaceae bacterium I2511]|nr:ATP-dependent Clp protease ATP-binding subunit [Alicyclobacillaceae bacterium I2511]